MNETTTQTGTTANGVPYLVVPATAANAPVVVVWHLLDAPRSEVAMASALPLAGLDATKIYLGLPLSGSRMPKGGVDEVMRLGMEEPVMNLHWAIHRDAVAEFPAAYRELRELLDLPDDVAVGVLGGSAGSSIAAALLAGGQITAQAAVFVSPMLSLRPIVDALAQHFEMDYTWTDESSRAADRMDWVARASEVAGSGAAIRVIAGLDDNPDGVLAPAREFAAATGADLQEVPGVAHPLAEEPGLEAAPQTDAARTVDALAADWLRTHLTDTARQ